MSLVFLFNRCFSPVSRTICSLPTMSRWFSRCVYLQLFSLHSVRFLLLCHLFFCIFARNNLIAVSIQCENIGTVFRSYFIYAVLFFAFRFSFISRKKKENRMLFFWIQNSQFLYNLDMCSYDTNDNANTKTPKFFFKQIRCFDPSQKNLHVYSVWSIEMN